MLRQHHIVLLVDDEEDLRQVLARILQDCGVREVEAANGAAALQLARKLNGSLSLVATNINMPVMDGLEFARAFRITDTRVPFLFITRSADPAVLAEIAVDGGVLCSAPVETGSGITNGTRVFAEVQAVQTAALSTRPPAATTGRRRSGNRPPVTARPERSRASARILRFSRFSCGEDGVGPGPYALRGALPPYAVRSPSPHGRQG